jgi:hypothetical protein
MSATSDATAVGVTTMNPVTTAAAAVDVTETMPSASGDAAAVGVTTRGHATLFTVTRGGGGVRGGGASGASGCCHQQLLQLL